jgi:DNA-binding GntR family transcriptional regulator
MHKKSRPAGRLVGLSNSSNRPKVRNVDDIYQHIVDSIVDQRLPPATKLNELLLCEIFNVGRRQIGTVLARLKYDMLVDLHPNRGAFVASPDVAEARSIFEARRAIEVKVVRLVIAKATREQLAVLKRNVDQESAARRAGRIRDAVRLSGGFHILLGGFCGNPILASMVQQLVARTSLVVSLYDNQNTMICWQEDHLLFIKHLEARASAPAVALMRKHLLHIEKALNFDLAGRGPFDLRAIYSPPGGSSSGDGNR